MIHLPNHQETQIDSDKYIADKNLLLGSHVRGKSLKEVSADEQTVKVKNTNAGTPTEDLDMSKIERAGLLTFDTCPEKTHD